MLTYGKKVISLEGKVRVNMLNRITENNIRPSCDVKKETAIYIKVRTVCDMMKQV